MVTACRLVWRACYVPPMVCDALGRYPFAVLSFISVLVMLFVRRLILMLEMFTVAVTVLPLTIPYFSFSWPFPFVGVVGLSLALWVLPLTLYTHENGKIHY